MSDVGEDKEAAWEMVCKAQDRLAEKEGKNAKNHELLSYLYLKFNSDREYAWQALLRSYSRDPSQKGNVKGGVERNYALAKYLIALEKALGEREAVVVEKSSGKVSELQTFFHDDLPF